MEKIDTYIKDQLEKRLKYGFIVTRTISGVSSVLGIYLHREDLLSYFNELRVREDFRYLDEYTITDSCGCAISYQKCEIPDVTYFVDKLEF